MKHNIVIVDDHILIAEALATMINTIPGFDILYVCSTGRELIEKFKQPRNIPDLVILDVQMPVMNGYEVAQWLTTNHPEILILALSMQDDEDQVIRMIRAGAKGYLLKSIKQTDLADALVTVMKEGVYYTPQVSRTLSNDYIKKAVVKTELSDKERELLPHFCSEATYREIAAQLFLSPRTVEGHANTIMEKLNVRNRIGLVLLAQKKGWI
ncbi:response regulator transcription factor [Chitinophaga filiformis]|uniref:DNA-binding response regulator, NarL/FixJ family, contains REC and HTH domains n=1 Tax=Chitinophaga filiformis TaxID=104663 RepID=A0A1G7LRL5_CHIFI|nr:response regulator transcription factor [Chitinophaga filiformis]SDF52162.1 DNA-binding response regulator, NarL/FixJ family, contains REC and HTH domains [Chitinophaga filiformis]